MGFFSWSSKRPKKVTDEEALRQNIRARLEAKSAATGTTEIDEWGPECVEGWNPADEARQAKRLELWQSSQAQGAGASTNKMTDSPSEFRPYQNPRQKPRQPPDDLQLRSEESNLRAS